MDFTVTIVTRNRADNLKEGLKSLTAQSYSTDRYEVIIVDNGSTDRTRDVAEGMAGDFRNFRYLYDPRPGSMSRLAWAISRYPLHDCTHPSNSAVIRETRAWPFIRV